jgi:hypothetical protein
LSGEAQTTEPIQRGMWNHSWALCEDGSVYYLTGEELAGP